MSETTMDLVNSVFESASIFVILMNIRKLISDKHISGITIFSQFFYYTWAIWNVYFYYAWGTFFSYWAALILAAVNTVWVLLVLYYKFRYINLHETLKKIIWNGRDKHHLGGSKNERV